jgi:hypothetical protein
MSGQIFDASIVAAPKQRNTDGEKRDIKAGRIPPQWPAKPAKLRQKDRDARWTVKYTKAIDSPARRSRAAPRPTACSTGQDDRRTKIRKQTYTSAGSTSLGRRGQLGETRRRLTGGQAQSRRAPALGEEL